MIKLAPRFHEEKQKAAAYCAAFRWNNISLGWKAQKRCIREQLGSPRGEKTDRLKDTPLPLTGRVPLLPKAWRALHAAINLAYATRHGYDVYFADVRGCQRAPSWCVKLSVYALLFDNSEHIAFPSYDWVMVLDEDAFFSDINLSFDAYLQHVSSRSGKGSPVSQIRTSRSPSDWHHVNTVDTTGPCIIIGKDVEPYMGCNAGIVFYHRSDLTREILTRWWSSVSSSSLYAYSYFIDQGAFNGELRVYLVNAYVCVCVGVHPYHRVRERQGKVLTSAHMYVREMQRGATNRLSPLLYVLLCLLL